MKSQDELWWARLDGEMAPTEAARYDRTLSDEDHRLMGAEMELERQLGEALARPAPQADAAWREVVARINARPQARHGAARWRRRLILAAVPAAVAVVALVVFGVGHIRSKNPNPWFLLLSARDASEQEPSSQAKEVTATARSMLRDRDMHMAFDPGNLLQASDAPCRLVSVRRDEHAGEPVVEMLFMCGGAQAKVIITRANGNAAHEIGQATIHGASLASRLVGDWLITAIGVDAPDRLLSLIEEAHPEAQGSSTPVSEVPLTQMSVPETAVAVPEPAVGVPKAAVSVPESTRAVPRTAVGVSDTTAVPPDSLDAPPQSAPESAVMPPDTAVAAPQSIPGAARAAPETPAAPEAASEPQTSRSLDKSEPTDTMV